MLTDAQRRAKAPVSAVLAGPYGHPLHPILITVPIGAWVASLVFDIASHLTGDPGFLTRGSQWLIALGVIGALAAALVGLLDLRVIPSGTPAFRVGITHMALNLLVTLAYAGDFAWRRAAQPPAQAVRPAMLALSAVALALLGISGYLGGKLAYRYGVRVADETTQAEGYTGHGAADQGP
ncbi:DUF2231 domain-containing protein [Streptomyces sp. NPDC049555]|uniref:DUF2231 domain-containing protein n=1 Tax=Streptomyces sp. NPDC049555 TaxID=3154930 RepID=UPI003426E07A